MTEAQAGCDRSSSRAIAAFPEFRGAEIHYSGTPELMADYVRLAVDAGAKIIGGCCGTSFEHLAAMRQALDAHVKAERPTVETIVERIGPLRNKTGRRRTRPRPAKRAASAGAAGPSRPDATDLPGRAAPA